MAVTLTRSWSVEFEKENLEKLFSQHAPHVPLTREHPSRPPITEAEKDHFYQYWAATGGHDLSIVQAASKAILLIPDPDLHLILSRQIGDDGAHAIAFRERVIALTGRDPIDDIRKEAAIASCAPTNSANAPTEKPQASKLTVLKMGHQKGMALLNILKAQGSLEKRLQPQGISVTWNEFSSTAPLLEGMGVGAIVFGRGGGTGSVFAQAADKPFVRVAASTSSTRSSAILVKENSPLKTLADLKGKKVAFAKGASSQYMIVRALEKVGLKYTDIQPVYLTPAEALPAFERGDFDAWVIWDPYTAEAERKLRTRLLADNTTVFGEKAAVESPGFYYAAPDFVRDHPDIVKIILQELEKAGSWAKSNYKDSAKLLSKLYKVDLATMEIVEERGGDRKVLPVTDEVLSGLQNMADSFYELKVIPKKIDVKDKNYNWVPDQKW